jgi:uncharacterized protein YukE
MQIVEEDSPPKVFLSQEILTASLGREDPATVDYLIYNLDWEYPNIDVFREIAYRNPERARTEIERRCEQEAVKAHRDAWEGVLREGERFQQFLRASDEERDAAMAMAVLLPPDSSEQRQVLLPLVLAELRHRPKLALEQALALWPDFDSQFARYQIVYQLWYRSPDTLYNFLKDINQYKNIIYHHFDYNDLNITPLIK